MGIESMDTIASYRTEMYTGCGVGIPFNVNSFQCRHSSLVTISEFRTFKSGIVRVDIHCEKLPPNCCLTAACSLTLIENSYRSIDIRSTIHHNVITCHFLFQVFFWGGG